MDGQPLKRRGPKPDSKPALTRRQELNRQAQRYDRHSYRPSSNSNFNRTHRERKELYIKALEQEVLRLKDNYSRVTRDKEVLADENRALKLLLAQHGIPWTGTGGVAELTRLGRTAYSSSGSMSGSYAAGSQEFTPPPQNSHGSPANSLSPHRVNGRTLAQHQTQPAVDYDQAGIDFVLTYSDPSKAYMSPPPQ